jgi:hypothetical protein
MALTNGVSPSLRTSLLATEDGIDWSVGIHALDIRANADFPHY